MISTLLLLISFFLLLYITEKRRLLNAVVLGLLGLFMLSTLIISHPVILPNEQGIVSKMGIVIILGSFPSMMFILSIATFFNSKVLLEKEGRKVRNLLLAVFGLCFFIMMIWYVYVIFMNIEHEIWHIFFLLCVFGFWLYNVFIRKHNGLCDSLSFYADPV